MNKTLEYWLSGFLVVAIVAVIVSKNSTTSGVIQAAGSALSNILGSIVAPISNGTAKTASASDSPPAASTANLTAPTLPVANINIQTAGAANAASVSPVTGQ